MAGPSVVLSVGAQRSPYSSRHQSQSLLIAMLNTRSVVCLLPPLCGGNVMSTWGQRANCRVALAGEVPKSATKRELDWTHQTVRRKRTSVVYTTFTSLDLSVRRRN